MPDGTEQQVPEDTQSLIPEINVPVQQQQISSASDFEVDAFSILDQSQSYNSGVNKLIETYNTNKYDDPEKAKNILAEYGNELRYKFKEATPSTDDIFAIAPIKTSDIQGNTDVERVDNWEKQNLDAIQNSTDPDYIAASKMLIPQIKDSASQLRRSLIGGQDSWIEDKLYRVAEGAVGPFAKLLGYDDVDKAILERTNPTQDDSLSGMISYIVGASVPFVLGDIVAGPAGGLGVIASQGGGEARNTYQQSLEKTGDTRRAFAGAALVGGAQAAGFIPLGGIIAEGVGRIGGQVAKEAASKSINEALIASLNAQKTTFGNVARATLDSGLAGSAATIVSNAGKNIALDEDGNLTEGAGRAFIAQALIGGSVRGATGLWENAVIEHAKNRFQEAKNIKEGKVPEPVSQPKKETKAPGTKTKNQFDEESFVTTPEGYVVNTKERPDTFEDRVMLTEEHNQALQEYINSEAPLKEGIFTDETNNPVELPAGENREVSLDEALANDIVIIPSENLPNVSGGRALTHIFSKLGARLTLNRNVADGAFGAFRSRGKESTIALLRSAAIDQAQFLTTLAHEGGHFFDKILNNGLAKSKSLQTVLEKLTGIRDLAIAGLTKDSTLVKAMHDDAAILSATWRPGWDLSPGDANSPDPNIRFNAYRNGPKEIYADVVSALLKNENWVKENHPAIHKAFEIGLSNNPELSNFWAWYQKLERDPDEQAKFNLQIAKESRVAHGALQVAVKENKLNNDNFWGQLKKYGRLTYEAVLDKQLITREIFNQLPAEERAHAWDTFNEILRLGQFGSYLHQNMKAPMEQLLQKILPSGIEMNDFSHYLFANRVQNEKTTTMQRVEENPGVYRLAAEFIREFFKTEKGVKPQIIERYLNAPLDTPEQINDALASVNFIGDTAKLFDVSDFRNKYPPDDPKRNSKAMGDYNRAVGRLNRRRESIPVENLRAGIEALPDSSLKKALQDATQPNAFAARKYLMNAGGYGINDAIGDINFLQKKYGPEKFIEMQKFSDEFHTILSNTHALIEKAQIFTPEMNARIKLNNNNWVYANVLKYFEGDDKISGSIRNQVGSLSETGEEMVSSFVKQQAIAARAWRQLATNNLIDFADRTGHILEKQRWYPGSDLFAERDSKSIRDKDNSYLIKYEEGLPSLYKLKGKSFENVFKNQREVPVLEPFLITSDALNKLFSVRQLKTIFNPAFAIGQKFMDRKLEAMYAKSLAPTLGMHLFGKLRAFEKTTRVELDHYIKTGELTGQLKKVVDFQGAAVDLSARMQEIELEGNTVPEMLYSALGSKMPTTALERIGIGTEKTIGRLGGDYVKRIAEYDELRTKVNGFRIGKEIYGMSDAQAAVFTRERFGIPNPGGGGYLAPGISRMFLFGNAHIQGLRGFGSFMKEQPMTAAGQIAYRALLPKLVITPLMGVAIRQLFGDEDGDKFDHLNSLIPENDKISRWTMLLGAQDGKGNFHNFFDIKNSDIQADWKAWYLRLPQTREMTDVTRTIWPLIKNLGRGNVDDAITQAAGGARKGLIANVQPMLQYMLNTWDIVTGENPQDYFHNKGVFSDNLAETGTLPEKFGEFGKYIFANQAPGIIPYNIFSTTQSAGLGEKTLREAPIAGPLMRSMIGISNYGAIEQSKNAEHMNKVLNNAIRGSTDDDTKELLLEFSRAGGAIHALGKGWEEKVGPDITSRYHQVLSWHARVWQPYVTELKAAKEAGDAERYEYILNQLQTVSRQVIASLPESEAYPPVSKEGSK